MLDREAKRTDFANSLKRKALEIKRKEEQRALKQ